MVVQLQLRLELWATGMGPYSRGPGVLIYLVGRYPIKPLKKNQGPILGTQETAKGLELSAAI